MFTGIVQAVGRIASVVDVEGVRTFVIDFPRGFIGGLDVGGSVSVDGVCLTATKILSSTEVSFDVILQSLLVTTLAGHVEGDVVNVERATKDGAEIGGHPLSGHVDVAAEITSVEQFGGNKVMRIAVPEPFQRYVFSKGYIAINGASLTVSECDKIEGWLEVWLIPETRRATNLDFKKAGDFLNIEVERNTQVVVDTVRASVEECLGDLKPMLEAMLKERGLALDELIRPQDMLPPNR